MKKILIFNDGMTLGGTEKLLVGLLNHLALKNCEVTFLLPSPNQNNSLLQEVASPIKVKYIHPNPSPWWMKVLDMNHMIFYPESFAKTMNLDFSVYDLIVCFKEGAYARLFSEVPVPKILWIHNILFKPIYEIRSLKERLIVWLNKKQLMVTRNSYPQYNKIICVSNACREAYIQIMSNASQPAQNIEVLFNAIDLESVVQKSKAQIDNLPQGITNFIILTRNSPEKRIDRLIKAAKRLKEEGFHFHIYILGEENESAQNDIEQWGLQQTITLLGKIDNPYPYILQCNWLLCTSERESFSLALLEAMALKTPVITTNCGGPADIVEGGKYGILVDNSSQGVYEGMKKVLDTPSLLVKYSEHLDEALTRFDYQNWLAKIDQMLGLK